MTMFRATVETLVLLGGHSDNQLVVFCQKKRSMVSWWNLPVSTNLKLQDCIRNMHMSFADYNVTLRPSLVLLVGSMPITMMPFSSSSSNSSIHFCPKVIIAKSRLLQVTSFLQRRFKASKRSFKFTVNSLVSLLKRSKTLRLL